MALALGDDEGCAGKDRSSPIGGLLLTVAGQNCKANRRGLDDHLIERIKVEATELGFAGGEVRQYRANARRARPCERC